MRNVIGTVPVVTSMYTLLVEHMHNFSRAYTLFRCQALLVAKVPLKSEKFHFSLVRSSKCEKMSGFAKCQNIPETVSVVVHAYNGPACKHNEHTYFS